MTHGQKAPDTNHTTTLIETHPPLPRLTPMTRRKFLHMAFGATTALLLPSLAACSAPAINQQATVVGEVPLGPDLPEINVISSEGGHLATSLLIKLREHKIGSTIDQPTDTTTMMLRTYGWPKSPTANPDNDADWTWSIPGPAYRLKQGDQIQLNLYNRLPTNATPHQCDVPATPVLTPDTFPDCFHNDNTTNFHYHGFHVSPNPPSDDVLLQIDPGQDFQFKVDIPSTQAPGTHWYHPHNHGSTSIQVLNGMAGALLVAGDFDSVPEIAAAKEQILVIQQVLNVLNLLEGKAVGAAPVRVNGALNPTIRMRPGEVQRWRFINATMQASAGIEVGFEPPTDDVQKYQIAMDGIQFDTKNWNPNQPVTTFTVWPGNRADFLVKANRPGTFRLRHRRVAPEVPRDVVPANQNEPPLLTVVIDGDPVSMALPASLPALPDYLKDISDGEIEGRHKNLVFSVVGQTGNAQQPPLLYIDNKQFDPNRVDQTMVLGKPEEWTIQNTSKQVHPFHIHVNPFQVTQINGTPQKQPWQWQDTVPLPAQGSVTIRHRFLDFTGKFVLHCHILGHEDRGMMQLVEIKSS